VVHIRETLDRGHQLVDPSRGLLDVGSSVYADPLLTADRELAAGSPAIDAGTALYVWHGTTVLDPPPSPFSGASPDIGAYEFASGSGAPTDPPSLDAPLDGAVDVGLTPTRPAGDTVRPATIHAQVGFKGIPHGYARQIGRRWARASPPGD
jgi:hypothetical protein